MANIGRKAGDLVESPAGWALPWALPYKIGGLFDDSDEQLEAIKQSNERIGGIQSRLNSDYTDLIRDFDLGMGQFRKESKQKRFQASSDLREALMQNSDAYVESLGPLNETSKARLKAQARVPALNKLLEFDLGTTESDLNIGLSTLMSSMQLGREKTMLLDQANMAQRRNLAAMQGIRDSAPSTFETYMKGLQTEGQLALALGGLR